MVTVATSPRTAPRASQVSTLTRESTPERAPACRPRRPSPFLRALLRALAAACV